MQISINFDVKTLNKLDDVRGKIPRSTFIRDLINNVTESEGMHILEKSMLKHKVLQMEEEILLLRKKIEYLTDENKSVRQTIENKDDVLYTDIVDDAVLGAVSNIKAVRDDPKVWFSMYGSIRQDALNDKLKDAGVHRRITSSDFRDRILKKYGEA